MTRQTARSYALLGSGGLTGTLCAIMIPLWTSSVGCLGYCPNEPPPLTPPQGIFLAQALSIPSSLETSEVEVEITRTELILRYVHASAGAVEIVYLIEEESESM